MPQTFPSLGIQAGDIPIIGPWKAKIGRMSGIVAMACNPTPEIWVKAFWSQVPFLIYTVTVPDCESVIVDSARGIGHRRRRQLKFRGGVAIEGSPPGKGFGWKVWRLYDLKERFGWYFTIVDATLDFHINWMSSAYQWSGCGVSSPGYATWFTGDAPFVEAIGLDWGGATMPLHEHHQILADAGSFAVPARANYGYSATINCVTGPFNDKATSIDVRIIDGNNNVYAEATADEVGPENFQTNLNGQLAGHISHATVYIWQWKCNNPGLWYITGSVRQASSMSGRWSNPIPCFDLLSRWF